MTRLLSLIITLVCAAATCGAEPLTLERCLERARENYPKISDYGLTDNLTELNLSEINRGWLPRLELYAQGTAQNVVPAFPDVLRNMLAQNGFDLKGMSKLQYKAGAELQQTIWDGGASKAARLNERASNAASRAALDVELYSVRSQVESLYFGILLMQEQMRQTLSTITLLEADHRRIESMVANGTAMQSDADMVEARTLTLRQNLAQAQTAIEGYYEALSVYVGEDVGGRELICPSTEMPVETTPARPELTLFDKRLEQNRARESAIKATVMPRVGFFAQAYYGYPGYNYFESMTNRVLSFNALAGVKVSWTLESLYTRGIARKKLQLDSRLIDTDRELFLFNTRLLTARQRAAIDGMRKVMDDDARIVELMGRVRNAAESQLENGVIDATALLSKINDENQARLNSLYHKILLVQNIYQLKNTLNR
ncbi:MAG: TolC family protein [Bacteroides sp.]|nr:TolC family protein [Bacteroides sp.]